MKVILTFLLLMVLYVSPSFCQLQRGEVTTSLFARQILTNATAELWRLKLGIGGTNSGGSSNTFSSAQFTVDTNGVVSIKDGLKLVDILVNGATVTNYLKLTNVWVLISTNTVVTNSTGKTFDFKSVNTSNTIARLIDITNIVNILSSGLGGTGTVTSVGLQMPTNLFVSPVAGSPVVGASVLVPALSSQSANTMFAAPTNASGVPVFRLLTAPDIISLFNPNQLANGGGIVSIISSALLTNTIFRGTERVVDAANTLSLTPTNMSIVGVGDPYLSISNYFVVTNGSVFVKNNAGVGFLYATSGIVNLGMLATNIVALDSQKKMAVANIGYGLIWNPATLTLIVDTNAVVSSSANSVLRTNGFEYGPLTIQSNTVTGQPGELIVEKITLTGNLPGLLSLKDSTLTNSWRLKPGSMTSSNTWVGPTGTNTGLVFITYTGNTGQISQLTIGSGLTNTGGVLSAPNNAGTVTSVGLNSGSASYLDITSSTLNPITSNGNFTATLKNFSGGVGSAFALTNAPTISSPNIINGMTVAGPISNAVSPSVLLRNNSAGAIAAAGVGSGLLFDGTTLSIALATGVFTNNGVQLTTLQPLIAIGPTNIASTNTSAFRELLSLQLNAQNQSQPPVMGFDTYYSTWDGVNPSNGGTNVYCFPSETFILQYATNLIQSGAFAAGYNMIGISDGWQGVRTAGVIEMNTSRFPSGGKAFVKKLHQMGFLVRIYTEVGPVSCSCGGPSSGGTNSITDANTYADWGIDSVTVDVIGPTSDSDKSERHQLFAAALQATNANISYDIHIGPATPAIPFYDFMFTNGFKAWMAHGFNTWQYVREYGTFTNTWQDYLSHLDFTAQTLAYMRPGHTPNVNIIPYDSLDVYNGNVGRLIVSWAALINSPLVFSHNLLTVGSGANGYLMTNRYVLKIQSDPLCIPPRIITTNGAHAEVWVKPLADGSKAFMILNRSNIAETIDVNLSALGIPTNRTVMLIDCWQYTNRLSTANTVQTFTLATNSVQLWLLPSQNQAGNFAKAEFNSGAQLVESLRVNSAPGVNTNLFVVLSNDVPALTVKSNGLDLVLGPINGNGLLFRNDGSGDLELWRANLLARARITSDYVTAVNDVLIADDSARFNISGFKVKSTGQYAFSSTTGASGAKDAALGRSASGGVEANNGTNGVLTNLYALKVTATHFVSSSATPTVVTNTGAGTGSPTVTVDTATAHDDGFTVTLTTGTTSAASNTLFTVTYATPYASGATPHPVMSPANFNAAALSGLTQVYVDQSTATTNGFNVKVGTSGLTSSTAYLWNFTVK